MSQQPAFITVPATEIRQSKGRKIYSFVVDGKQIHSFATITRLKRGSESKLEGYQRPEVLSHIDEIRTYLESPSPMLPNGIVLAFNSSVKFLPAQSTKYNTPYSQVGTLRIPTPRSSTDPKPGYIVDGQQRVAAIRDAQIRQFPMVVTAFITDDLSKQTEQFILVNSTKPLPKGLLYELLPNTEARLPTQLHKRRLPARLLEVLNFNKKSPLFGKIQTPTSPQGLIKDNSILRMLDQSLSDGVLFRLRKAGGDANLPLMTNVLMEFWSAVKEVFKDAWDLPPRKSRLMHGAGIISVGNLMDHIGLPPHLPHSGQLREFYVESLLTIAPCCAWTEGTWRLPTGDRKWNDLQNTRQDVALLTDHLQREYDARHKRAKQT